MSRLAIIYSNNFGEETDVDIYFINRIIGVFDRVIVACGDRIGAEERNKIEAIGGEILVGDNLDAMSMWRYTFKEYLGLDYCKQFEQIMIASLDSFYGVSINETMFVKIQEADLDVLEIQPWRISGDVDEKNVPSFTIFNKRPVNDLAFEKFWDKPDTYSNEIISYFDRVGYKSILYVPEDISQCTIVDKSSLCKIDFWDLNDTVISDINLFMESMCTKCKRSLIRYFALNNSYMTVNNVFHLNYPSGNESETKEYSMANCVLVIYVDTLEQVNYCKQYRRYETSGFSKVFICIKEEFALLLNNEFENIVTISEGDLQTAFENIRKEIPITCKYILIKIADQNKDINEEYVFVGMSAMDQNSMVRAINYRSSLMDKLYISNLRERGTLKKKLKLNERVDSIEIVENAILCRPDILEIETIKEIELLPYYLHRQGILVGKFYMCDIKKLGYQAINFLEILIDTSIDVDILSGVNINEVINDEILMHESYAKLDSKVKELEKKNNQLASENKEIRKGQAHLGKGVDINALIKENEKLVKENKALEKKVINPAVREVPIVIDIGVRGALRNWFRKIFKLNR